MPISVLLIRVNGFIHVKKLPCMAQVSTQYTVDFITVTGNDGLSLFTHLLLARFEPNMWPISR